MMWWWDEWTRIVQKLQQHWVGESMAAFITSSEPHATTTNKRRSDQRCKVFFVRVDGVEVVVGWRAKSETRCDGQTVPENPTLGIFTFNTNSSTILVSEGKIESIYQAYGIVWNCIDEHEFISTNARALLCNSQCAQCLKKFACLNSREKMAIEPVSLGISSITELMRCEFAPSPKAEQSHREQAAPP